MNRFQEYLKMTLCGIVGALAVTGCNLFAGSTMPADTTQLTTAVQNLHVQAYQAIAVKAMLAARAERRDESLLARISDVFMGRAEAAPVTVSSLGSVCGYAFNGSPAQPTLANQVCVILASSGQMVNFDIATGTVLPTFNLYYTSADCGVGGGDAPFVNPNESYGPVAQPRGLIFRDQIVNSGSGGYWQVLSTDTLQTFNAASERTSPNGACSTVSLAGFQGYQSHANTTAIGGVTNQPVGEIAID